MKKSEIQQIIERCFSEQIKESGIDYTATQEDKDNVYKAYKIKDLGDESIGYYVRVYLEPAIERWGWGKDIQMKNEKGEKKMEAKSEDEFIYLGEVSVDSGQILIVDPCYLDGWKSGEYPAKDGNNYNEACEVTLKNGFGEVFENLAIACSTTWGDGSYPVFGITNKNGQISRVLIDFEPEEEA